MTLAAAEDGAGDLGRGAIGEAEGDDAAVAEGEQAGADDGDGAAADVAGVEQPGRGVGGIAVEFERCFDAIGDA